MDTFTHLRILFGMILSLSLGHILRSFAQIVQQPAKTGRTYWVHLLWGVFLAIYTMHFWWWEFALRTLTWNFQLYIFVALYAISLFFLSLLIFPEKIVEYDDYRDYFYRRRGWIFGVLTAIFIADIADTYLKGLDYHNRIGLLYDVRAYSLIVLCIVATRVTNKIYHASLVCYAIIGEAALIACRYQRIG